jgi:peptide/nickel transport system permease protein
MASDTRVPIASAGQEPGGQVTAQSAGSGRLTLAALGHNYRAMAGFAIIVAMALFCFAGPLFYHFNTAVNLNVINNPPVPGHPLGTDLYGIDVLGRLMVGGQSSLELGFSVGIASTVIGLIYGALSGMLGGIGDAILMRIVDTVLAVPTFILLIVVASMFSLSLTVIIAILVALSWPGTTRLVRGQVLALREREYIQAARIFGATKTHFLIRHLIPNTLGVCIVAATFAIADSIYALAGLSFLGIGPPPPFTDWGTMLNTGVDNLNNGYWWQVYPPLIVLILVVVAFRMVGDAFNDIISGIQPGWSSRRRRRGGLIPFASRP